MNESPYDSFVDAPVGRYTVTGASIVWCESPSLCGAILWSQQSASETESILHVFDQYPRHMASVFDIVLDTRGVQSVDASCLRLLFAWLQQRHEALRPHIRLQASVIREGPIGFMLTGLLPVVGRTHPYRVFTDAAEAFHAVGARETLREEVDAIVTRLRGTPAELRALWTLLERTDDLASLSLERASELLAVSSRTLQRTLSEHGTSFRQALADARFTRAQQLLEHTDDKLSAVSAAVGLSERALTALFNGRTGLAPAAWRKRHTS